jgi:hypothetical protein
MRAGRYSLDGLRARSYRWPLLRLARDVDVLRRRRAPVSVAAAHGRYVGLDPRVRQSGSSPARHGHVSKQGSATARHVLCEAANATMRSPGPLRAFGQRIQKRRGRQIAVVAVARKRTTLAWHMLTKQQDYIYERPALTFRKLRKLEMTVGSPARSNPGGRHGPGTVDNPAQWAREHAEALAVEADYRRFADVWTPQSPSAMRSRGEPQASAVPAGQRGTRRGSAIPAR